MLWARVRRLLWVNPKLGAPFPFSTLVSTNFTFPSPYRFQKQHSGYLALGHSFHEIYTFTLRQWHEIGNQQLSQSWMKPLALSPLYLFKGVLKLSDETLVQIGLLLPRLGRPSSSPPLSRPSEINMGGAQPTNAGEHQQLPQC